MIKDNPIFVRDINLHPGEFCFGSQEFRIRTLLGSCVALVLWHPEKKIGGMSHIILPEKKIMQNNDPKLPGKFADESFELFKKFAKLHRTDISEFVAKLFGGANMISKTQEQPIYVSNEEKIILEAIDERINIGKRNSLFIKELLNKNSISILSEDLGGNRHRKVYFTIWNGEVWMEKSK